MRTWPSLLVVFAVASCGRTPDEHPAAGVGLGDLLGSGAGDAAGFARATEPPTLHFPADHGPHPAFRSEWWYVTGNLDAQDGRRFGVQLVFFRQALAFSVPARSGSLATRDLILAHAAVTDVDGQRFCAEERLARLAGGVAELQGGAGVPFRVACVDWSAASVRPDGFLPLDLRARGRGFSFALRVAAGKPVVLQGDRGLSQKSDQPGNASIYYSMTRLPIDGTIRLDGVDHAVRGLAWLDREWSTSALGPDQVGWDWFSLQLDSGEEIMWYRLRRGDGSVDGHSRGSLVDADGHVTVLAADAVIATPGTTWRAADGGARYPVRWRLQCASPPFDLEVEALLPSQELRTLVRYWEGAVAVRGTRGGVAVGGRGYLEMTGYGRAR